MDKIRLTTKDDDYPIIYSVKKPFQVVVWDFWTINSTSWEAFVLEVDRVLLTKDGSLLGLFRTVGEAAKEVPCLSSDQLSEGATNDRKRK